MSKLERVRTEATVLCDHKSMKERNLKKCLEKIGTMCHCRLHPFDVVIPSFTDDVSATRFGAVFCDNTPPAQIPPPGDFMVEFVGVLKLGKTEILYSTFSDKVMSYL